MSWSEQQLAAITTRDANMLVAAAAGSGKTSVLVERIIRRIIDADNPLDIDRILVMTFTNAAAAEMRARIGAALAVALRTDNAGLAERQMALLNSSSISTIHSFCQSVVRQNFHRLDIDPQFRIASGAETDLLKADLLQDLFEERYGQNDEAFLELVDHYGSNQSDAPLYDLILELYEFSRSHPWPDSWLACLPEQFDLPEGCSVDDTPWSELLREKFLLNWQRGIASYNRMLIEAEDTAGPASYLPILLTEKAMLEEIVSAAKSSWQQVAAAITGCVFDRLPNAPKGCDKMVCERIKELRNGIKADVKEIKELFFDCPAEELINDMRSMAPLVKTLAGITIEFAQKFAAAKREKSLVDFSDLEHFCLEILSESAGGTNERQPSAVAMALQDKFVEIMVDEYQDTNGVQEAILQLVARRDGCNLFMVGDVKQSIYRFRQAEPELFMRKYREYPASDGCIRIDLSHNFRSRPGILHAVNFFFTQVMASKVAELEYGSAERLNPGPDYPLADGVLLDGPVELHLINEQSAEAIGSFQEAETPETEQEIDLPVPKVPNRASDSVEELTAFEAEARLIAQRISELKTGRSRVYDKSQKQYRDLAWRDIVILLRAPSSKATVLLDTLRAAGIPAYADVESGYFRETEVQIMLSLLHVIDNPRQDIHLAGVLRSSIGGFLVEELAEIRLAAREGDMWDALMAAANRLDDSLISTSLAEKSASFIHLLEEWRSLSRRKGVPDLVWQIFRDTGYYEYVGGLPGGLFRQANLRALYDRARQYEATNYRGLFRFLRFIESMQEQGADLAVARALGENEDVVRIMSIHKSKGLEFPIVFVTDLGKKFNLQDSTAAVVCHKKLGIGPYVISTDPAYRYPTLARHAIAYKLVMESKAEELRVLYVAMTRAREKLILIGSVKKLEKRAAGWNVADEGKTQLPDAVIAGAKSYLDWFGPTISRHPKGEELRSYGGWADERSGILSGDPSDWQVYIHQRDELAVPAERQQAACLALDRVAGLMPLEPGEGTEWVDNVLGWKYPQARVVGKPAKLSVTEIKRRFEITESPPGEQVAKRQAVTDRPRFMQQSGKLTGAEMGVITHSVMQHIDIGGDVTPQGIADQIAALVDNEVLLPEQLATVNVEKIAAFFSSELGLRLRRSACLRRELPFSMVLPATRFFPELAGSDEGVFIQGVIDALFDEEDGLVLVDYKTDWVSDAAELAERYAIQLQIYAEAVETILKRKVKEKYLYAFHIGEAIRID